MSMEAGTATDCLIAGSCTQIDDWRSPSRVTNSWVSSANWRH